MSLSHNQRVIHMNKHFIIVLLRLWSPPKSTSGVIEASQIHYLRVSQTKHHPHIGVSHPHHPFLRRRNCWKFDLRWNFDPPLLLCSGSCSSSKLHRVRLSTWLVYSLISLSSLPVLFQTPLHAGCDAFHDGVLSLLKHGN